MVKYLSLFSGVEAASVAWEPLGWEPMAFAEIEPFPSAVLAARFPSVPNLGDVTAVDWEAWKAQHGSPDVIVAGSPCQAFSVAGKRLSLEDARGNLSLFTAELVRYLNPRVFIWENVPGALSTKDNAFGCLLGDLVGADAPIEPSGKRWTGAGMVAGPERVAAWRILDAQYFGVAQRRRRIFLVACPCDGPDPAEILFELESVCRDTPPSREPREGATTEPESGAGSSSSGTLPIVSATQQGNAERLTDLSPTITASAGMAGNMSPWCMTNEHGYLSSSLEVLASGAANAEQTVGFSHTLTTVHDGPPIVLDGYRKSARAQTADGYETWVDDGVANTINCFDVGDIRSTTVVLEQKQRTPMTSAVRRLTPVECERLQGFPDNWTAIPWRGKPAEECPDSHRYKAMGNSMAVPVMRWLGSRIDAVLNGTPFVYGVPEACRREIEGRG